MAIEKLQVNTLRNRVAKHLRSAILNGDLKEGERLVERKLAAQFGTSSTAIREALIQLEGEGYVTKKANAGAYVTKVTSEKLEAIFIFRRLVEAWAVEEATRNSDLEKLRELEVICKRLLDAARNRDVALFIQADEAFHRMIWRLAGNEYVENSLSRVVIPYLASAAIHLFSLPTYDYLRDAQSHLRLAEIMKSGDPAAAREEFLKALEYWLEEKRKHVFIRAEDEKTTE